MKQSPWLTALTTLRNERAEKPGKAWKTRHQIAEEIGRSLPQADRLIRALGAERRVFKVETLGGVKPIPHYRLRKIAKENHGRAVKNTRKPQ